MFRVNIKPLSVNDAWRGGRRFNTKEYKEYRESLAIILPKLTLPKGRLTLRLKFGLSNGRSDLDNPVKPFVDFLQEAYGFNDKIIYKLEVEKVDTPRGQEFIDFIFESYES